MISSREEFPRDEISRVNTLLKSNYTSSFRIGFRIMILSCQINQHKIFTHAIHLQIYSHPELLPNLIQARYFYESLIWFDISDKFWLLLKLAWVRVCLYVMECVCEHLSVCGGTGRRGQFCSFLNWKFDL